MCTFAPKILKHKTMRINPRPPIGTLSFLLSLLLMATCSLSAQGTLSGIVANPWGQPLSGVSVELFTDDGSRFDDEKATSIAATRTDTMGRYMMENIRSGKYAVRFNQDKAGTFNIDDDITYQTTIISVNCDFSYADFLLDVNLNPLCILGTPCNVPSAILKPCHIKVQCYLKSHRMAKVEFETLKDKERSTLYTKGWVTQYFPAGTGRVRIRIYDHVGEDQWQLRKTMTRRPRNCK